MFYYGHRLLFKLGFYDRVNITSTTIINNKKFRIPVINGTGYHHLLKHENWLLVLLKQLFSATSDCFIDVGMNIGQTLLKVNATDASREYFGFEPNPLCNHYCRKLAEANGIHNCSLFPVGLFDHDDILTLYMDKDYSSGASVLQTFRKKMERFNIHINVPVFTGDKILGKFDKKFGILKADVEGAELEVIKGSLTIIKRDLPFLILEILPVYSIDDSNGAYRKSRQDEMLSILFDLGYKMFLVNETDTSLIKLDDIEVHGDMGRTNYLFMPRDKTL